MFIRRKNFFWSIAFISVAVLCLAADYGSYLCRGCAAPMNPVDVRLFVSVYVNPNVPLWRANDTVSICNGLDCVKYLTPTAAATTWTPIERRPDSGRGYKGEGVPLGGYSPVPDGTIPSWDPFPVGGSGPGGVVTVDPMQPFCPPVDLINCA